MNLPTAPSPAASGPLTVIGPLAIVEWVLVALAMFAVYFLLQENGALISTQAAEYLHEITHDARHALGAPCH